MSDTVLAVRRTIVGVLGRRRRRRLRRYVLPRCVAQALVSLTRRLFRKYRIVMITQQSYRRQTLVIRRIAQTGFIVPTPKRV